MPYFCTVKCLFHSHCSLPFSVVSFPVSAEMRLTILGQSLLKDQSRSHPLRWIRLHTSWSKLQIGFIQYLWFLSGRFYCKLTDNGVFQWLQLEYDWVTTKLPSQIRDGHYEKRCYGRLLLTKAYQCINHYNIHTSYT